MSRPNDFELLSGEDWRWIIEKIKSHPKYKKISLQQLDRIIENGVMGKYNKTQYSINAFTIFKWLEQWWEDTPEHERNSKSSVTK